MINLNVYLKMRWTLVAVTPKGELKLEENERYEIIMDALWAFRFQDASYVYVKDEFRGGCVLNLSSEAEALAILGKHWPHASDFVWADRCKGFAG